MITTDFRLLETRVMAAIPRRRPLVALQLEKKLRRCTDPAERAGLKALLLGLDHAVGVPGA